MLDEFPALGRLDFFEGALAFLAGYSVRCFLIAQSLNQIDKAYGTNNAIVDNCHVRIAFAPNDERTAKRLSDTLGTMTELRAQRDLAGHRLSPWLTRLAVAEQETPRPLLTAGEILQLPPDQQLVLVSGTPPIRARKLRFYADANFSRRCLPPPRLQPGGATDRPRQRSNDWSGQMRLVDYRLQVPWSDHVAAGGPPRGRQLRSRAAARHTIIFGTSIPIQTTDRPMTAPAPIPVRAAIPMTTNSPASEVIPCPPRTASHCR